MNIQCDTFFIDILIPRIDEFPDSLYILNCRQGEMMTIELDNSKLKKMGWNPEININIGLEKIIKEYNKND